MSRPLWADAPAVINYQGKLADSSGNPQTGTFPMAFSLYANPTGGAALFTDDRTGGGQQVPVTNGVFTVLIGSGTTLTGNLASTLQGNTLRYLQVTVSGTDLLPRQRLVASPYALAVAAGSVGANEIQNTSITPLHISTNNLTNASNGDLLSFDGTNNKFRWVSAPTASQWTTNGSNIGYTGGNVGVGTTSPGGAYNSKLHVVTSGNSLGLEIDSYTSNIYYGPDIFLYRSKNNTIGAHTATSDGDNIGSIQLAGDSGSSFSNMGSLKFFQDGAGQGDQSLGLHFMNYISAILTPRFTIKGNGNVGIGTSSPTGKLSVHGTGNTYSLFVSTAADGNVGNFVVTNAGNVGIGTTTPSHKAEVVGDLYVTRNTNADLEFLQYNAFAGKASYIRTLASSDYAQFIVDGNSQQWRMGKYGSANFTIMDVTGGNLLPVTIEPATPSNTLFLDSSGNVGIGTTAPSASFEVNRAGNGGAVYITNDDSFNSAPHQLIVRGKSDPNQNLLMGYYTGATDYGAIQAFKIYSGAKPLVLQPNGGNVGIGTATPGAALDVGGDIKSQNLTLTSGGISTPYNDTQIQPASGLMTVSMASVDNKLWLSNSAGTYVVKINSNGDTIFNGGQVGIGRTPTTNELEVNGNASKTTATAWLANSDRRIKKDIKDITDGVNTLMRLRPVEFKYVDEYRKTHNAVEDFPYYNFIAQEYQQVFPNSVKDSGETVGKDTHILQVDTYNIIPYAVKAIQEQQAIINELKAEIADLKTQTETLSKQVQELKKR